MSATTTVSIKMSYFTGGRYRRVTLERIVMENCDGISETEMLRILQDFRDENKHITCTNIYAEQATISFVM